MKKVYEYIKKHNLVDVNQVAIALSITANDVFSIIERLRAAGYIKMVPPVPLSTDNDGSCYYTITGKEYRES